MGARQVESRVFHKHRQWVRKHACVVPGCESRQIEFAHVRNHLPPGEMAGIGIKPHDAFGVPLCHFHHAWAHGTGHGTLEQIFALDLLKLALEFARQSPVLEVREKVRGL